MQCYLVVCQLQVTTNAAMFDGQQCLLLLAGLVIVLRQLTSTLSSASGDECELCAMNRPRHTSLGTS